MLLNPHRFKESGGAFVPTTLNPADKAGGIVLSDGNRAWSSPGSSTSAGCVRTVAKASTGKWYVEFNVTDSDAVFGIASASHPMKTVLGNSPQSIGFRSGYVYVSGSPVAPYPTFNAVGVTGLAIDLDARSIRFFRGASVAGPYSIPWSGDVYVAGAVPDTYDAKISQLNCGQAPFSYPVPSGHTEGF